MALNLLSINNPNTGAPAGDLKRGIPRYLVISAKEFDSDDLASSSAMQTAISEASLLARDASDKLVVLPLIANVELANEANKEGTLNQGFKEVLLEGNAAINAGVRISNRHAQILRQWGNRDLIAFTVDENKRFWGNYTSASKLKGEEIRLFVGGDGWSDGQNSKTVLLNIVWTNPVNFYDFSKCIQLEFNVADYGQLMDVQIVEKAARSSNVFTLGGEIETGIAGLKLDIHEDYATELANAARWKVTRGDTGGEVTLTSVTSDAGNAGWDITLDSTEYAAIPAATVLTFNLAAPSVLHAAGATGIEGKSMTYTK